MSGISTYTTLASAVQSYTGRADIGVVGGNLDYLVQEVEQELNARLRVRRMLTTVTPTVSAAGVVTLPADYGGWKRFQVRDGAREWDLDLKSAEQTTDVFSLYLSTGVPKALITTGSTSQIWPFTNTYTYAALYYARIPNLTAGAPTNWVIANFAMAYLYGCLAAARGMVMDDARFPVWVERFNRAIEDIEDEDAKDLDARDHALLAPNTSLFGGRGIYNVLADST